MFVRRFDVPGKLLFPRNASAYAMLVNNAVMGVQKRICIWMKMNQIIGSQRIIIKFDSYGIRGEGSGNISVPAPVSGNAATNVPDCGGG